MSISGTQNHQTRIQQVYTVFYHGPVDTIESVIPARSEGSRNKTRKPGRMLRLEKKVRDDILVEVGSHEGDNQPRKTKTEKMK